MYYGFLMIYLPNLLLLFFDIFDASKDLIRDSQRLQFCYFVRLQEKAQDDISQRAAIDKEPSTMLKDKEDQSKYYPFVTTNDLINKTNSRSSF